MTSSSPVNHPLRRVVIIGRPNVGKSTLFNRLTSSRRALVHDEPGVTRDRIELQTRWWVRGREIPVLLVDTGGLGSERFAEEIEGQVRIALESADAVLAVFDARTGLTPADQELFRRLSRSGMLRKIPVIGVINKVDAEAHEALISDFYSLGLERVLTVSAEHGRGMDDLRDTVAEPWVDEQWLEEPASSDAHGLEVISAPEAQGRENPRIAIVGRPNVGKSTLLNAILGEERMITSPIAGTTVDAVDSVVELGGRPFTIVDTAGIRRKSKTEKGVEVLSVVQARKALERADVALLVLDGEKGITDQDEKIGGLIEESGCSVALVVNKWDTQGANRAFTRQAAANRIRGTMAYLKYAPLMFVSAKKKQGLEDLGGLISDILHQRDLRIPTHELTEWVRNESTIHNPKNARFYLSHQSGRHPPTFVCHVNDPEKVHFSLRRHLVNALRERWGFMGSPIRMLFIQGTSKHKAKPRSRR